MVRVHVDKKIIEWAIARAGYEVQAYLLANPKVNAWLQGDKQPTLKQLEAFSRKIHVPFGYFFLEKPPEDKLSFPFFRAGREVKSGISLNVYDAVQLVRRRQDWLSEYLREEEYEPLTFVGKFNEKTPYKTIVTDMRKILGLPEDWAHYQKTWEHALDFISGAIESLGVVVSFSGIVGNNTKRPIPVEECRGFVLVDDYAPFMFVNSADAKAAQMFTIVHELAHVWIGKSAGFDMEGLLPANDPIEKICDQVAAEFLVPQNSLLKIWEEEKDFKKLNKVFKVSPIVVARRALDLKLISKKNFFVFYDEYVDKMKHLHKKGMSGGDFYATAKRRAGVRFVNFVHNAVKEQKLLYRDAYKLTGLKGNTYEKFVEKYFTA